MTISAKFSTASANKSIAPYTNEAWVNITSAYTEDASNASVTAATFDTNLYSQIMYLSTFAFAIPVSEGDTIITGIQVRVKRHHANGDVVDALVQLTLDGLIGSGNNKANTSTHWPDASDWAVYGGQFDKWGLALTPGVVNASTFGIFFAAQAHADDADAYVNCIEITIYYEALAGVPRNQASRRTRFNLSPDGDVSNLTKEWLSPILVPAVAVSVLPASGTPTASQTATFTDTEAITMNAASPCVVSRVGHGLAANREIWFKTSGALYTGITQYTHYYVKSPGLDSFNISAAPGGAAINTSGSQSGTHNLWTKD
jgi:hypothetical protein